MLEAALRRDPDQLQSDARRRHHQVAGQNAATTRQGRGFDWEKLNPQRGALIERDFNREIKT